MRLCKRCDKSYDDKKQSSLCPDCRSALGRRNKRKGNANELRYAKYLQDRFDKYNLGYIARRTPRSGGIREFEQADILISLLKNYSIFNRIHFELKNQGQWSIEDWFKKVLDQEQDSGKNRSPVLIVGKPNSNDEYAITSMEFLVEVLCRLDVMTKELNNK